MKKILLLLFISGIVTNQSLGQVNRTLSQLEGMDFSLYTNKPINTFLAAIPSGYTLSAVHGTMSKISRASEVMIEYPGNINIEIIVSDFKFMNPDSKPWDIALFRKENIYILRLYDPADKLLKETAAP